MAITTIIDQPDPSTLHAVYRPIYLRVRITQATAVPVVYCDVYVDDVYYKTITKTQYASKNGDDTFWDFFVQGAVQELMKIRLGPNGGDFIINDNNSAKKIFCRFRASSFDVDGFIVPETPHPVQATGNNPSVPSEGIESSAFYVFNATLQHHQNQDFAQHLNHYKTSQWAADAYPLSHRQDGYEVAIDSSDFFPVVLKLQGAGGIGGNPTVEILFRNKGQSTWFSSYNDQIAFDGFTKQVFLIPAGPKNLKTLFPDIKWLNVKEYYLRIYDTTQATLLGTSPIYKLIDFRETESIRIHFLSYLGQFDGATFLKPKVTAEDSSSEYTNALSYPLQKTDTGIERSNVRSNDTYEARRVCKAEEMEWMGELKASPKAFLQWQGTEGQADDYLPIVILSGKFDKIKNAQEYEYDFVLQFKFSNESFSIRN